MRMPMPMPMPNANARCVVGMELAKANAIMIHRHTPPCTQHTAHSTQTCHEDHPDALTKHTKTKTTNPQTTGWFMILANSK